MIITIVCYLSPGVSEKVSKVMPINKKGDFANATTGASMWKNGINIVGTFVLLIFISVVIRALKGIQGGKNKRKAIAKHVDYGSETCPSPSYFFD